MAESDRRKPTARGSRVRLRVEAISPTRVHLLAHAKQGHVGTVVEPLTVGSQWILVRFDGCEQLHRVAGEEIVRF